MATWSKDELDRIGGADEFEIAPRRRNGGWFRAAQASHEGRIQAGGIDKDVTFVEEPDSGINNRIDAAYRNKYRRYADTYVPPMLTPEARSTTLKLVPRSASA